MKQQATITNTRTPTVPFTKSHRYAELLAAGEATHHETGLDDMPDHPNRHESTRAGEVSMYFFLAKSETMGSFGHPQDLAFPLDPCYGPLAVVDWCALALRDDRHRLTYKLVSSGVMHERVLSMRFDNKTIYLDIAIPGNLYLHLLLCLNQVMYPYYELRRYRFRESDQGDLLVPMSPAEWHALEVLEGKPRVHETFQQLTERTTLVIRTDLLTIEKWWL